MSIPVDDFTTPGDTVRKPGDFRRRGENGPPIVRSATKTRKRKGNKPDLLAAAEAEGIQVPDKVTVPQLHELLGPEPADDTYGRPSGFGEQIDDIFPIVDWKERQVVLGIAMRPDLLQRLQHLDPDDPNAERDCLQGIAAAAHEAADSSHNADRGTFVHELTAWVDNGRQGPRPVPDPRFGFTDAHLDAIETGWVNLLTDNHLTPVAVERPVVNDDLRLAGTLDRLCTVGTELWFGERCIHQGTVVVVDIKTSKLRDEGGQPQYWESYPIQIEAYRGSVPYDVDTDERGGW